MQQAHTNNSLIGWWKKAVFENYANFNGRARRAEYWYFALANFILLIPFYIIGWIGAVNQSNGLMMLGFGIYFLAALGTLVPSLAVGVRRLHDLGKSGWYYFVGLIPFVGGIILLVWFFTDGNRFTNAYGEDPKNPAGPVFDFEQSQAAV
ncbi:MAG: DUF805 domain-containing protein [Chitinophagaceae bacterium]|nr:DUF805 domain-containing protein [Chitinophagaceae bacterium]